jgi:hypothetical protein
MEKLAKQFIDIFDGLHRAYGTYNVTVEKSSGKRVGKAAIIKQPVTTDLWLDHLTGKQGIGIIPINDNSCCKFGAIDIDVYSGLNIANIVKQVNSLGFPLIPCRSKSGGCHLFIFTKEEVPAELLVGKLKEMAAVLGYGNCEIYPRQTKILVERGDIGQFINVPYFNGVKGLRYAIDEQGTPLGPEHFIHLVNNKRITETELSALKVKIKPDLEDGPPCLQYLITQGFPEGTRNDGLFNLGVYLTKAFPDDWKDRIDDYNRLYMDPPLKSIEISGVTKSLERKEYFYTCDKSPLISYCNKSLCMTRKFGIGVMGMPVLSSLTKFDCNPPIWFVNVDGGGRMELLTDDLQNQLKFQKRCIEALNLMPPIIAKNQWQQIVQKLLDQVIIIEAPADASPVGQLIEYLEKFCTSRVQAQSKEELLLGKPFTDNGKHYFRMSDFLAYLERNHFREFKVNKITSIIKEQLRAEHHFFLLKGKGINTWALPEFRRQTESHDVPDFENVNPY